MPTNTLTDAKCKGAKPADKAYKLFDGGGLFLFVTPTGSRIWRLAYRLAGKQQTMSIGPYPAISLADARTKRDEVKSILRAGEDPMAPRRNKRVTITLEAASGEYWAGRKDLTDSYRSNAVRGIEMHLLPTLGARDVGAISRQDLMNALERMDAAGLHVYVRKVWMWASQVFEWAIERGFASVNPAAQIRPERAFGKAKVQHFAALSLREVPEFLSRLRMERELQSVLACRLLAYTWVRTTELRMMEWEEIDQAEGVWLIPEGKMKRRRDHVVPLTRQAMTILEALKARSRGGRYVFPAEGRLDRPMSENAVLYLIRRIGYQGRMTGHGWRSVGSTWANERGFSPDAIERQLAHVPKDTTRAAYNRAEYLVERRTMLQAWADWLSSFDVDAGGAQG
ncbi:tyrosine-type recombinase/integrase [Chitiniphilus shinanonensis]|uniref:tyrosine-type recombinase/integrase n=1 Tax=Chitiniphilus shinanonensis TaxID=553088 RepID=UPI00305D773B